MAIRDMLGRHRIEETIAAGQGALEQSRFEDAANLFRSVLRTGPRSNDEEAQVRELLSVALEKRGLTQEMLEVVSKYEKPIEFSRLSINSRIGMLLRLGWGYCRTNDIPRAIALFNHALPLARSVADHALMGECYFAIGRAYSVFSEVRIARDHYTSALEHYRQVGNWSKLAESYINIGYISAREGDYRNGLHSVRQALAIIGDRDEPDLAGRAHWYLGIIYDSLGEIDKALNSSRLAIEHFRRVDNPLYAAINQNNYALQLIRLGEWARAEEVLKGAIETLSKGTSVATHGGAYDTLAQAYMAMGRLDEAERSTEKSLQILSSIKNGEWAEASTQTTVGRIFLMRGMPASALPSLERAVDIATRRGEQHDLPEAQLWLAEALLQTGRPKEARGLIEAVRTYLREVPNLLVWGLMARMSAKIDAADGHIAASIQSLAQSTSIYTLRRNPYHIAVNQILLAELRESQGNIEHAVQEVESALEVFKRLGAVIDLRNATAYLEALRAKQRGEGSSQTAGSASDGRAAIISTPQGLASAVDGFIAQRLVQASASRDLLLHELVAIVKEHASSRGALVAEIMSEDLTGRGGLKLRLAASVGVDEAERADRINFLASLAPEQYGGHFVYRISDNQTMSYLFHIIAPTTDRYLTDTVNLKPLLDIVEQGLETHALKSKSRRTQVFDPARLLEQVELPGFICASRAMTQVLERIHKIRSSDVTVLITGESGTGKELIARALHAGSSRRTGVFLPFNCSAAPHEMMESQLFGFRKGSFTGAVADNEGIIRAAERGTLFLDEIGDLPFTLQPKLLRFLQEGEIHPLGEPQPRRVDVRVIAATNAELEQSVAEGKFREDLFHRINVIRIQVPPLRQRREEIPALINHYLNQYQQDAAKSGIQLSEETVDLMVVYDWPGNIRQLCNEVRRMVAFAESGTIITPESLSSEIVRVGHELDAVLPGPMKTAPPIMTSSDATTLAAAVEEIERRMIQEALHRCSGNIARAAKELGLSRKGLYLKMDRLNFNT